ncbi:Sodium/hydrogen exchanger 9B2 [Nymphon striatum]|nr:Sodium/hydrogen exchanger 9B2 [Nymphon striatum]
MMICQISVLRNLNISSTKSYSTCNAFLSKMELMSNLFIQPDTTLFIKGSSSVDQNSQVKMPQSMKSRSQKLLSDYGIIKKSDAAGQFHFLPIGLRVLKKLMRVIDDEMDHIGAQKILMPTMTSTALLKKSGRLEKYGQDIFLIKDRHNKDLCLGPTFEEAVTSMVSSMNVSAKMLPLKLYQISRKYRDEERPCFGLLRGREFYMKDLYTFDVSSEDAIKTYESVCNAYEAIFKKLEIEHIKADGDPGNIGGQYSHEFHIIADIGQDTVKICSSCKLGINLEVTEKEDEHLCSNCGNAFVQHKCIEVGHTFLLSDSYSKVFGANLKSKPLQMGCYGIGVTRLLAAAVEVLSTENNIRWPKAISPYQICIIPPKRGSKEEAAKDMAGHLYQILSSSYPEDVIIDDRDDMTIGQRLLYAKRLGFPYVLICGKHVLKSTPRIEFIDIYGDKTDLFTHSELLNKLVQMKGSKMGECDEKSNKNIVGEEMKPLNPDNDEQTDVISSNTIPITGALEEVKFSEKCRSRQSKMKCLCCQHDSGSVNNFNFVIEKLYLCEIMCVILLWMSLYSIIGCQLLPEGHLFALFILIVCCIIGGNLISLLHFPPLLGNFFLYFSMLLVGFLLRNVPHINVAANLNPQWASALRSIALVVILIRAGLGLDPQALKQLSLVCLRLAFTPCLVETIVVAVSSHLVLGLPWLWGFMLGFVLSAVSPAVVVPSMISIQEKGLGCAKGIPTLIIAAASVDDVLAISGFGIVLGITFTEGSLGWTIAKGPIEVLIGLAYGIFLGVTLWVIPYRSKENKYIYRFLLLSTGGTVAVFGSRIASFGGAGALGCLILSFVAAVGWKKEDINESVCLNPYDNASSGLAHIFANLWYFFQPILFGLIGAEITVDNLDASTVGYGIAVLSIGLFFRIIASFFVVLGAGLTIKERLFIALAWLPKATVQAAIGPVALDLARAQADKELEHYGLQVLTISVLVILITAPIGAAAIALSAPKLLTPQREASNDEEKSV